MAGQGTAPCAMRGFGRLVTSASRIDRLWSPRFGALRRPRAL